MTRKSPLADDERRRLLSRVEAMQNADRGRRTADPARDAARAATQPSRLSGKAATDFATLPGYEELLVQRSLGERFGVANPYHKMHEGLAGARTRIDGRTFLNFSCYDYLGLNGHLEIMDAAKTAMDRYGLSSSASRIVAGERAAHRDLETALARHYDAEAALVFVSGYGTNVGVIGQLVGARDLVIADAAAHNSITMGGVMSGAARRSFAHNDLDQLEQLLTAERDRFERVLIVVEGLYSMDGDVPDLARLIEIKSRHCAWLMVDEAHALGVIGARGSGIAEHCAVDPRGVDIWMGTLSKTLVGCGGYIAGSGVLVDYLRSFAGAFVYSVGMPPLIAAAGSAALDILHREPQRVARLQANARYFRTQARRLAFDTGTSAGVAVAPIIIGDSLPAVLLSQRLFERGINVQPVLHPGVPARTARLRFFVTAMHTEQDIDTALSATAEELAAIPAAIRELNIPGYPS